jgi:hypothetical protein
LGKSPPIVNVLWGAFNFFVAAILLFVVLDFKFGLSYESLSFGAGFLLTSLGLARYFQQVNS